MWTHCKKVSVLALVAVFLVSTGCAALRGSTAMVLPLRDGAWAGITVPLNPTREGPKKTYVFEEGKAGGETAPGQEGESFWTIINPFSVFMPRAWKKHPGRNTIKTASIVAVLGGVTWAIIEADDDGDDVDEGRKTDHDEDHRDQAVHVDREGER